MEIMIGRLAKAAGLNIQTIRYYERRCLLRPNYRRPSGYRVYDGDALRRLRFIKNAQALGFTLQEISVLLNLRVSDKARCGDVRSKAQAKLDHVVSKIQDLQALHRALSALLRACRSARATSHCPILQSLELKNDPAEQKRRSVRVISR